MIGAAAVVALTRSALQVDDIWPQSAVEWTGLTKDDIRDTVMALEALCFAAPAVIGQCVGSCLSGAE